MSGLVHIILESEFDITVEHLNSLCSAATEFKCSGRFYFTLFHSLAMNPKVKELLKLVHICQKIKVAPIFMAHGVYTAWAKKVSMFIVSITFSTANQFSYLSHICTLGN